MHLPRLLKYSLSAAEVIMLLLAGCTNRNVRDPAKSTCVVDMSIQEKQIPEFRLSSLIPEETATSEEVTPRITMPIGH